MIPIDFLNQYSVRSTIDKCSFKSGPLQHGQLIIHNNKLNVDIVIKCEPKLVYIIKSNDSSEKMNFNFPFNIDPVTKNKLSLEHYNGDISELTVFNPYKHDSGIMFANTGEEKYSCITNRLKAFNGTQTNYYTIETSNRHVWIAYINNEQVGILSLDNILEDFSWNIISMIINEYKKKSGLEFIESYYIGDTRVISKNQIELRKIVSSSHNKQSQKKHYKKACNKVKESQYIFNYFYKPRSPYINLSNISEDNFKIAINSKGIVQFLEELQTVKSNRKILEKYNIRDLSLFRIYSFEQIKKSTIAILTYKDFILYVYYYNGVFHIYVPIRGNYFNILNKSIFGSNEHEDMKLLIKHFGLKNNFNNWAKEFIEKFRSLLIIDSELMKRDFSHLIKKSEDT